MKYLIIIIFFFANSCVARELIIKESIIDFNKINTNKIFINKTSFNNNIHNEIANEINTELINLFKNNNKLKIFDNMEENDLIIVESKILDFVENIYLDQYSSPYSINNNLNNRNSANLQLSISLEIKIIYKENILLNEKINNIEAIQINNINNFQIEKLNDRNNNIYLDLKNKLIQNTIKKIFYYINPSYIYINVSE